MIDEEIKVVYSLEGEAECVFEYMRQILNQYGYVLVADLYDLSDIPTSPEDDNYGWYDLLTAEIMQTKEGYTIKLPKPEVIKK